MFPFILDSWKMTKGKRAFNICYGWQCNVGKVPEAGGVGKMLPSRRTRGSQEHFLRALCSVQRFPRSFSGCDQVQGQMVAPCRIRLLVYSSLSCNKAIYKVLKQERCRACTFWFGGISQAPSSVSWRCFSTALQCCLPG